MVPQTLWPRRASSSAVTRPISADAPVTRIVAIGRAWFHIEGIVASRAGRADPHHRGAGSAGREQRPRRRRRTASVSRSTASTALLGALLASIGCVALQSEELDAPEPPVAEGMAGAVIPYAEPAPGAGPEPAPEGRGRTEGRGPIESITFESTACLGTCPMYQVTLMANGTIVWKGEMFVETVGFARARAPAAEVKAMLDRLAAVDLDAIPTTYGRDAGCRELWTDHPSTVLTFSWAQGSTTVTDYSGCYGHAALEALRPIEAEFEALVDTKRWIGRYPQCLAYPGREAWSFPTRPGAREPWPIAELLERLGHDGSGRLRVHAHASRRDEAGASLKRAQRFMKRFVAEGGDAGRVELLDHGTELAERAPDAEDIWADEGLHFELVSEDCLRGAKQAWGRGT